MIVNPSIIEAIRKLAWRDQYDLHRYYKFDNGQPSYLNECPHPLTFPSVRQYDRMKKWKPTNFASKFLRKQCPKMKEDFVIYGSIGRGTFGSIFAARTRIEVDGKIRHYAIKVQPYLGTEDDDNQENNVGFLDRSSRNPVYFTHKEAAILNCLRGCERASQIHSGYLHAGYAAIVMNQFGIDYDPRMDTLPELQDRDMEDPERIPGFHGCGLFDEGRKRHLLTEVQVRKVVSHLLEALMFLNDRRMNHQDLSHRNYLVDEDLNTQLIDFDVSFTGRIENYRNGFVGYIPALEHMMRPEVSQLLLDHPPAGQPEQANFTIGDVRDDPLWRIGVIMFELLHGYTPWDSPDPNDPKLAFDLRVMSEDEAERHVAHRDDRRRRMINEPLPISEETPLTQDCVDVLNAVLANDPNDRPSIEELASFPWFQGSYVDSGADFRRPARPARVDH